MPWARAPTRCTSWSIIRSIPFRSLNYFYHSLFIYHIFNSENQMKSNARHILLFWDTPPGAGGGRGREPSGYTAGQRRFARGPRTEVAERQAGADCALEADGFLPPAGLSAKLKRRETCVVKEERERSLSEDLLRALKRRQRECQSVSRTAFLRGPCDGCTPRAVLKALKEVWRMTRAWKRSLKALLES